MIRVSPVSSWALGIVHHGVANEISVFAVPLTALRGPDTPWRRIVDRAQGVEAVDLRGEWLYLRTSEGAPRYRLVRWSLRSSLPYRGEHAEVVLPQGEAILAGFAVAKDALYVHLRDAGVAKLLRLEFNVKIAAAAPERRTKGREACPRGDAETVGRRAHDRHRPAVRRRAGRPRRRPAASPGRSRACPAGPSRRGTTRSRR